MNIMLDHLWHIYIMPENAEEDVVGTFLGKILRALAIYPFTKLDLCKQATGLLD